jgi:hypothetical protein
MSRYFTKSAVIVTPDPSDSGRPMDVYSDIGQMTVHEDVLETWTGLLDAQGNEIHRSERVPLGFRVDKA